MMEVSITAIVFISIYLIIRLFVRRKERLIFMNKIDTLDAEKLKCLNFGDLMAAKDNNMKWPLRISFLMLGIGLGTLLAYLMCKGFGVYEISYYGTGNYRAQTTVTYIAGTLLFGGLGLLASYLIERKEQRKDKE